MFVRIAHCLQLRLAAGVLTADEHKQAAVLARKVQDGEIVLVALRALDTHDRGSVVNEVLGAGQQIHLSVGETVEGEAVVKRLIVEPEPDHEDEVAELPRWSSPSPLRSRRSAHGPGHHMRRSPAGGRQNKVLGEVWGKRKGLAASDSRVGAGLVLADAGSYTPGATEISLRFTRDTTCAPLTPSRSAGPDSASRA